MSCVTSLSSPKNLGPPPPLFSGKIQSFSPRFSSIHLHRRASSVNGEWVRRKTRFQAKSADADDPVISARNAQSGGGRSTSFLSVLCPLLKLCSGGDPSGQRNDALEVATSSLSTLARLPWGSRSVMNLKDGEITVSGPSLPLQLFEFEACPFCRRVREAMTELDLSVEVYPCPKGSARHRELVRNLGGKEQFPFLIDPNTGVSIYESGDIVNYLFEKYGNGTNPSAGLLESTLFTGWMPTILRAGRGMTLWEKARRDQPPEMLELFSYENNPYARIVREALCELELPYILHNVGEGSRREKILMNLSGSKEVPFIIDPNTGTKTGDHKKILDYLFQTYSSAA
ncbi:uncharacterized protein J3R85_014385 [Psidium guajava]|nr:uncharacterized protein J3R85_014385 [Psidium guajava]